MKKKYLIVVVLFGALFNVNAQFTDDFESYDPGPLYTTRWTTWNGVNDGFQNAIVSTDQAVSGTKSIYIGPGQGPQDAVLDFGGVASSGIWNAKWFMYISSGSSGYFNVQGNVDPNANANMEFLSGDVFFNADNLTPGQGENVDQFSNSYPFDFPHDQWFIVGVEVNVDIETYRLVIDGYDLGELPYSSFAERFDGIDFYALDPSTNYYVDDVEFAQGPLVFETVPPIANCVGDFTISLDENGMATIEAEDIDDGSTDNSGTVNLEIDITDFDCSNVGDNTVTLTVTDPSGNSATCTTTVTVEDTTAPVANCSSLTFQLDEIGLLTITADDIDNNSTDACGIDTKSIDVSNFDCDDLGENQVVLTVMDVNGNSSSCTATVTIEPFNMCPSDVTVNNDSGSCGATNVELGMPTTSESCSTITSVTNDAPSEFTIGTTTVTWTTTFASGLSISCQQNVTVIDNEDPVVTCPADFTVILEEGETYEVPDFYADGDLTVEENCPTGLSVSQNPAPGTILSEGTYPITVTAEDNSGNMGDCSFEVTVEVLLGTANIDLSHISLYPNPANSFITISNPERIDLKEIQIYDISGRLLSTEKLQNTESEVLVDVSALSPSTYFLIVKSEKGQVYKQIIKE